MTLPTFGAAGTYYNPGGSGTSAAPAVPAGTASGELVLVFLYKENQAAVTSLPTGFTQKDSIAVSTGTDQFTSFVFWKRCTTTDTGTYTFSWTGSAYREAVAIRISGAVTSGDPFDTGAGAPNTASTTAAGTAFPATTLTTQGADRLLVHGGFTFNGGTKAAPTGFTLRASATAIGVSTAGQATAGSTGSVSGTTSSSSSGRTAFLGAILPVASAVDANPAPSTVAGAAAVPGPAVTGSAVATPAVVAATAAVPAATAAGGGGTGPGQIFREDAASYSFADGSTGHTCTLPSTPAAGNTLVLFVNSDTTVSTPSGWTLPTGGSFVTQQGAYAFYRLANGTETAVVVTTAGNFDTVATYVEYSGTAPTAPFIVAAQANTSNANSTTTTPVDIDPDQAGALVVAMGAGANAGAATAFTDATWTGGLSTAVISPLQVALQHVVGELLGTADALTVSVSATWTPSNRAFTNVGTIALAFAAEQVSTSDAQATPGVVATAATIPSPTVSTAANVTVTPGTVAAIAAVPAATVLVGGSANATPATVAATAAIVQLTPTVSASLTPDTVANLAAVNAPTVVTNSGTTAVPARVTATAAVPTPAIHTSAAVAPGVVEGQAFVRTPSITADSASSPWTMWDGAGEVVLALDGVWNGSSIDPLTFDEVTV